jgi:hypothetical protein
MHRNTTTLSYSTAGCTSQGVSTTAGGSSALTCACSHLTEFAILYQETLAVAGCASTSTLGSPVYAVLMCAYLLVALVAFVQLVRIALFLSLRVHWLAATEHALILGMCLARALNMSMYYYLYRFVSLTVQFGVSGLPYLFISWSARAA